MFPGKMESNIELRPIILHETSSSLGSVRFEVSWSDRGWELRQHSDQHNNHETKRLRMKKRHQCKPTDIPRRKMTSIKKDGQHLPR